MLHLRRVVRPTEKTPDPTPVIGGFGGYYYYKRRQKRIPMATVQPTESATGAATPVGGQLLVQPPDLPD